VSEVLGAPGATDSLFDVLAAAVAMLSRGPRVALLGFAGGGIVAPLRGMGCYHPLHAVDLDGSHEGLFRELSSGWCGEVRLELADAARWLRRRRASYDLILEDLSVLGAEGETKPLICTQELPELIAARLSKHGVAAYNLLPVPGWSMEGLVRRVASAHGSAVQVRYDDYENRLVLAGPGVPSATECGQLLRRGLRGIGSDQAGAITVRTVRTAR
jgi:spermidine synthase